MDNKNLVILAMVGSTIIVVADDIKKGGISGTHLLALGVVFIALSAANDVSPRIGGPFALLVFAGIALTKGPDVISAIGNVGSSSGNKTVATNPGYIAPAHAGGVVVPPKVRQRNV
jgi:hypothetical protein